MSRIAEIEPAETLAGKLAELVHRDEGAVDYGSLLEALARRQARRHGLAEETAGGSPAEEALAQLAGELGADEFEAMLDDPHLLGWFHQHVGEPERAESHRAHNRDEAKHDSQSTTTQLYTPRWIADALTQAALEGAEPDAPTVLDPAVGGGQFLLAAYDAIAGREPGAEPEEIVGRLRGVDVDARAVRVARRALKLRVARHAGGRRPEAEALVERQIRPGDGLFDEIPAADVVLTNPPYMGSRSMPGELKSRIRQEFEPFHGDLYAAFIDRCHRLARSRVGVLAQQTIWYLKRFRRAREALLERGALELFVHLGPHACASLTGEKANVVGFVQRSGAESADAGDAPAPRFVDLREIASPAEMRDRLAAELREVGERTRRLSVDELSVIPGSPVSHWLSAALRRHFDGGRRLGDVAEIPGSQNKTGANREYVRDWREVPGAALHRAPMELPVDGAPRRLAPGEGARWIFYSKGGRYAPWWGNWQNVVDWSPEAREFYDDNSTSNLLDERYRFRQAICYTDFVGRDFNARWMPPGCLFDMAGPAIFREVDLFALLALLNC